MIGTFRDLGIALRFAGPIVGGVAIDCGIVFALHLLAKVVRDRQIDRRHGPENR